MAVTCPSDPLESPTKPHVPPPKNGATNALVFWFPSALKRTVGPDVSFDLMYGYWPNLSMRMEPYCSTSSEIM